jgi:SAM-dependent methyltransferase
MHGHGIAPSPWVVRWAPLVAQGGSVLDVACGNGRHVHWFAARGCVVTAVDRDAAALAALHSQATVIVADIEGGPWPVAGREFDAVVVTNYLWRPLLPAIVACVAPGGVLLYETFAAGNETVGKPSRPDFLLQPGELLRATAGLRIVAYEDGFLDGPPRFVQRVCALRQAEPSTAPPRHPLDATAAR